MFWLTFYKCIIDTDYTAKLTHIIYNNISFYHINSIYILLSNIQPGWILDKNKNLSTCFLLFYVEMPSSYYILV